MGKWAEALAAHLAGNESGEAEKKSRHPPMGAPSKPSKGGFEPFEGEGVRGYGKFSPPIGGAANDLPRTCRACTKRLPAGNCDKPIEAGLLPAGSTFAILWAPDGHAATCKAFAAKRAVKAPDRPYRLSAAEGDAAHAVVWDDAGIARFVARVALLMRRGFNATDADDLAERLHLRDVTGDDRAICVECRHLAGRTGAWYCGNDRAADVGRDLPAALVTTMQRCAGFKDGAI